MSEDIQFIRLSVVLQMTSLSKTGLYEAIHTGDFPRQVKINSRSSAWVKSEVLCWIKEKIEARSQEVKS